jgi:membrane protein YdbS with pleckstrin-like domain
MSEKVEVKNFRPAWKGFYWHMTGIVVCLAAIVAGWVKYPETGKTITIVFLVLAAAAAVHMVFKRFGVALLVKPEEISLERGLIGRHSVEISTANIRTIEVNQSVMQRLLNVGDLLIGSSATSGYEISVKNLADPYAARDLIQTYERASKNKETPKA